MTGIIMPRRRFIAGLVGLVAAPMVVKASSLMPVRAFCDEITSISITSCGSSYEPGDIICTAVRLHQQDVFGGSWTWEAWGLITHRADLSDLKEPYLSQVKEALNGQG